MATSYDIVNDQAAHSGNRSYESALLVAKSSSGLAHIEYGTILQTFFIYIVSSQTTLRT